MPHRRQKPPICCARKVLEIGIEHFVEKEALASSSGSIGLRGSSRHQTFPRRFGTLCVGLQSFGELRDAAKDLIPLLEQKLGCQTPQ